MSRRIADQNDSRSCWLIHPGIGVRVTLARSGNPGVSDLVGKGHRGSPKCCQKVLGRVRAGKQAALFERIAQIQPKTARPLRKHEIIGSLVSAPDYFVVWPRMHTIDQQPGDEVMDWLSLNLIPSCRATAEPRPSAPTTKRGCTEQRSPSCSKLIVGSDPGSTATPLTPRSSVAPASFAARSRVSQRRGCQNDMAPGMPGTAADKSI